MSKTGLAFHRKNQSFCDLSTERPKSIAAVRQALRHAVGHLEGRLSTVEREFYVGRTCDDDIRAVLPHVKSVMVSFDVTYIHGAYQFKEMIDRFNDVTEELKVDKVAFKRVCEYHRKIQAFVPHKFGDLISDTEEIIAYLDKYLLSYSHPQTDDYLETASHYELKRTELKDAILSHLHNIAHMSEKYGARGTPVSVFGLAVNEVARRCDCGDLPFLLVFPQCCQNIRNACQGIYRWITADEEYADFLACDIRDLDTKRQKQKVRMREAQELYFVTDHKLKQTKREIKNLIKELDKLKRREKDNVREVKKLEEDIRMMYIDIEMREDERQHIKDIMAETPNLDCCKQLERIAGDISELRYKIPATQKEIVHVTNKISFISDKRSLLTDKQQLVSRLKKEVVRNRMDANLQASESKRLDNCFEVLKYIHLQKTSPASTKNIFHQMSSRVHINTDKVNLPKENVAARDRNKILYSKPDTKAKTKSHKRDDLDKATGIVAKFIDGDWHKLYRKLPFYPPRGENTLDKDVIDISEERMRTGQTVKAKDSLSKWRRMHTRANLVDLKATLEKLNRKDVIDHVDKSMKYSSQRQQKTKVAKRWNKLKTYNMITSKRILPTITGAQPCPSPRPALDKRERRVSFSVRLPSITVTNVD